MTKPGRPIRFLVVVVLGWTIARSAVLWPQPDALGFAGLPIRYAAALMPVVARGESVTIALPPAPPPDPPRGHRLTIALAEPVPAEPVHPAIALAVAAPSAAAAPAALPPETPYRAPPAPSRLSLSAWAIGRDGGGSALAQGGQLGGSQAGLRAAYALDADRRVAVAMRLSTPLSGVGGREAAVGLEWQPIARLPVRLTAERRFALDRGARDGFALGLFGGVGGVALPAGLTLDAYGQAGVVGLRRRAGYVDGALRVDRPVMDAGPARLAVGAGLWGAAQPGVSRLDVGPQLVLRVPTGPTTLRVGLDWRHRIAGNARPGSGPALSLGADF
jgi:hypothetical protein